MNHIIPKIPRAVLFIWLLLFCSFLPFCQAILFTDISEYSFPKEGQKGLRIIQFDTDAQHLQAIDYVPIKNRRKLEATAFENENLSVDFKGLVRLKKLFDQKKMACRSFGKIMADDDEYTFQPPADKTLHDLKKIVSGKKTKPYAGFIIKNHKISPAEKRSFDNLSADKQNNSVERGFLGERLTELLFLSLGTNSLSAQNKAGQGLDGVFFFPKDNLIVLSESKCRNESKSAATYLKEELNEQRIIERIGKIPNTSAQTSLIKRIWDNRHKTYKLVQRVLNDGSIESVLSPLNIAAYARQPDVLTMISPPEMEDFYKERLLPITKDIQGSSLDNKARANLIKWFLEEMTPSPEARKVDKIPIKITLKNQVNAQDAT